jgi:hypothetical protein
MLETISVFFVIVFFLFIAHCMADILGSIRGVCWSFWSAAASSKVLLLFGLLSKVPCTVFQGLGVLSR